MITAEENCGIRRIVYRFVRLLLPSVIIADQTVTNEEWLFLLKPIPAVSTSCPKLYAAGWTDDQISEQKEFYGWPNCRRWQQSKRRPQKRSDYLLRYRRDFPIAVVEAKTFTRIQATGFSKPRNTLKFLA